MGILFVCELRVATSIFLTRCTFYCAYTQPLCQSMYCHGQMALISPLSQILCHLSEMQKQHVFTCPSWFLFSMAFTILEHLTFLSAAVSPHVHHMPMPVQLCLLCTILFPLISRFALRSFAFLCTCLVASHIQWNMLASFLLDICQTSLFRANVLLSCSITIYSSI